MRFGRDAFFVEKSCEINHKMSFLHSRQLKLHQAGAEEKKSITLTKHFSSQTNSPPMGPENAQKYDMFFP